MELEPLKSIGIKNKTKSSSLWLKNMIVIGNLSLKNFLEETKKCVTVVTRESSLKQKMSGDHKKILRSKDCMRRKNLPGEK